MKVESGNRDCKSSCIKTQFSILQDPKIPQELAMKLRATTAAVINGELIL